MKKILLMTICASLIVACGKNEKIEKNDVKIVEEEKVTSPLMSNMADDESLLYVENALKDKLNTENVEEFIGLVKSYNESVGTDKLNHGFNENINPTYDVGAMIDKRQALGEDRVDTDCRINAFLLVKDELVNKNPQEVDDSMLFADNDNISKGKIFDPKDHEKFKEFFSRIKTETSKDVEVHAKVMEDFYKNWEFPEKADLISVIIHDVLDGSYLYVGHVGVLVEIPNAYLFVEKISFEEAYQAIKFPSKEACYKYLKEKFKDFTDPDAAAPFIMDNGKKVA